MDELDFVITDSEDEISNHESFEENLIENNLDLKETGFGLINGNNNHMGNDLNNENMEPENGIIKDLNKNEILKKLNNENDLNSQNGKKIDQNLNHNNDIRIEDNCNQENEMETEKRNLTSQKCWICKEIDAKYKCPKCLTRTCSVACVKLHKKQQNCDGIRCKTTYVAKENFQESNLLNDYYFLEEVNRCASKVNNDNSKNLKYSGMNLKASKSKQMNIDLRFLPYGFSRHKQNTTFYCKRSKQFLWRVEWIFNDVYTTIFEKQLNEEKSLNEAVQKFIDVKLGSKLYDSRLYEYTGKTLSFYMKKLDQPANKVKYYKLDGKLGLKSNLNSKVVIEFPQIYVVSAENCSQFENNLIDISE